MSFTHSTSAHALRRVAIFAAVLVMSMVNVGTMWGESQQHIQGVACSNPNNYPKMKINVKRYKGGDCSSWGEWEAYAMVKAGITFEGKQLFSGEYWTCNGLYNLQYQMLDAEDQWKEQYEAYAGSAVYDYYNNYVYDYDTHEYYSRLTFQKGHVYFDATGWEETDIKLTIGHANFQRYYGMSTVSGTNLYYYHLDLNDAFADAMGFGVVGNTSASDGTNWLTNVSDKASEYTGYRHYGMNNSGGDIRYLIVNKGKAGEQPDVDYDDDYTSLNSTQTFYSVVKEAGGSYTTANSKATISISSYELTSQGGTTNRTPSISTSANNTTVSACRTANTRLQVGTVASGYQFDGWWTGATSGSKITESTDYTYNPTEANTLYARFSAKSYSITLNRNGGSGDAQVVKATYNSSSLSASVTTPIRDGYTFVGWFTKNGGSDGVGVEVINTSGNLVSSIDGYTDGSGNWVRDGAVTLYARWKSNTDVNTYNFQYGSGAYYGSGWTIASFSQVGSTTEYNVTNFTMPDPEVKTKFYVGYNADFYKSSLGTNGAKSLEEDMTDLRLAPGTLSIGTATGATGKLVIWSNSDADNLYVGFEPSGYNLSYNSGRLAFGSADANHMRQTSTVTLTSGDVAGSFKVQLPTASSYVDCAKTTTDDDDALNTRAAALVSEQSYPDIPDLAAGAKGRFVIWDNNSVAENNWYLSFLPVYTVSYNANGGTGDAPASATEYLHNENVTILGNSFTRTGYTFDGWNTKADGTSGDDYVEDDEIENIAATVTLYAKWTENTFNVTAAYGAGGSAATPSSATSMGEVTGGDITATAATGYTFSTWSVTSGSGTFGSATSASTKFYPTAASTVTASFTANVYTVEEHNNGGRIWSDSIGSYTYGVGATLPMNVTKWAYDFDGWYDNSGLTGSAVTAISTSETGNKDYYAKWTSIAQEYPIASHPEFLAAQEGDIIVVNVTGVHTSAAIYLYDLNYTEITHLSLSATGKYTFQLTAAQAAGIRTYGLLVTGNNFTFDDVDILYRKTVWTGEVAATDDWEQSNEIANALFANLEAGDYLGVTVSTINYNKDSWHLYAIRADYRTNIIQHDMSDTGIGLDILTDALVDSLQHKKIILVSSYLTSTAIHTYTHTRTYSVTLNTNGGTINAGDVTNYTFGTSATLPTNVTKTGYTFAGWYDNSGLTGSAVTTITTSDYGNKEYWAKWTANNYTVTLNTNSGTINTGDVTSYTYGVGANLPTDVTRNDYTFDGWFDNSGLTGDAVTEIADDATGDKEYWAKWTEIKQEFSKKGSLPIKIVSEGDLVVVNVSEYGESASIVLKDKTGTTFASQSVSANGRYAFPLTSAQASALHDSLIVTGTNYTGDVSILFRKTIWTGTLSDTEGWTGSDQIASSLFSDMEEGEFVGIKVSAINGAGGWYKCGLYAGNYNVFVKEVSATGMYIGEVTAAGVDSLQNKWVGLGAQFLDISTLYTYVANKYYSITYKECDNSTVIEGLEPTTYAYGVDSELPTPTKSGYTFDAWYNKYCVIDEEHGWIDGCQKTSTGTSMYGSVTYLAKWHQTVTLNMQGVCPSLTPTVEYLGTALSGYSLGSVTLRSGVLQGYFTASSGGTQVLNADGTFFDDDIEDYITDGKWIKEGATTLYAQYDATIDLPDTLDVSNYVAYGGGLTLKGDSLDYTTGTSSKRDGWAEWKVNVGKYVYNVTTLAHFSSGHQWKIYLINGSDTISSCAFDKKYIGAGVEYSETKSWDLSEITSAGTYTLQVKNVMANGEPKLLYVAMDPITVTYDANGGSCATETAIYAGSAMTLPSATKSGYVFEGWYSGGTKIGNAGGSYEPTASITLIAKWGIITALPDTLTKENVGDYSSDMTWYGDDDEYFDFGPEDKANLGRWAKWEVDVVPCTYNVTIAGYYPNSHRWQLVLTNGTTVHDTLKVSSSDVDEWDLTGIAKGTYTLELKNIYEWSRPKIKSLVLSPDLYTITYDAGEYGSGSIAAGKKIGCHNFTLSSSTFTRAGYEQDGWATSDGGSKAYNLGATYSTDAALTLYPHWTCATPPDPTGFAAGTITDGGVTFTITDDADAASYEIYYSTDDDEPDGETEATTTADSKTKEVTGLTAGTTYYAWVRAVCDASHKSAWVALTGSTFFTNYSITMGTVTTRQHDGSTVGGTISTSPSSASAGDEVTLTATPKSGYVFVAWQIVDGSSADKTKDLLGADSTLTTPTFTMPAYSVTVNATFARQYTITYKEEDKTTLIDGLDPTTYIYGVGATLPTPERTGYTFDAWYKWTCVDGGSGFADGCKRTAIDNDAYGDYIFYGKFTPNTYTITLNNQSATSAGTESISVTYNDDENLTDEPAITSPTKICYAFGGYYTETAGGGSQIIDADGNVNASVDGYTDESKNWIHAGDVTLYAKWTQVNLALKKTAVAGYEDGNPAEVAGKVTDGTTDAWVTWHDQPTAKEYVYIDLGAFYHLSSIEVDWGADYSTDYILQACQNAPADSASASKDYNWFTLAEVTDAAANSTKTTAVDAPARYVRLHSLSRSNNCIRVKEIRVYGTGTATTYTTPTLSTAEVASYPSGYRTVQLHLVATDSHDEAIHTYRITDESGNISVVTTDEDDLVTISGLSHNVRHTLTVQAMDPGALLSESEDIPVLIWDPTANLALGKTVVAGYTNADNVNEAPEKLVDGSTSTAWTTFKLNDNVPASDEWFYIDLGAYYELDSVQAVWGDVYSTDYLIQARQSAPATTADEADDTKWFILAEEKGAEASSTISTEVNGPARYIRVHSLTRSGGFLRLYEFRVFGSGFATADENAPEITSATASYNNDGKAYLTLTATDTEDGTTKWFRIYNPKTETWSLQQTDGDDQIVITGLEDCTDYTFEVQAMDSAAQLSEVSEILVNVPVIKGTNLALGKTATAGIKQGGFVASNAVDGNTGTMWSGNANSSDDPPGRIDGTNQWLNVDLGKNYDIDSIKIMWGSNSGTWPQDYEIQVSYNGTDYTTIVHREEKDNAQTQKYLDLDAKGKYVRVWATRAGTDYGMEIIELEVYGQRYTEDNIYDFTGQTGSSTAWATAANWTKGAVPSATDTVRLLAPVEIPADNTIQVAKVIVATGGSIGSGNSLTIGGKLTVAAGGALVVTDSIKRCADAADFSTLVKTRPSDIVVKSSAAKGNGTLLFTNTGDSATVELYCKASTEAIPWTWQYVGVPFTTADPQAAFWGGYMYYWPTDASGWESVTKSTTLSAFTGYSLTYAEAGHIFSMEGELTATTSKDIAVPAGKDMVVGNSWTAPIQIKQLRDADFTNLLKNVYFYNTGNDSTKEAGQWSVDHYDPGTYVTVPIHASPYTGDSVISALQGFFVTNTSGSAGTLHLSYADHVRPAGSTSVINGQMHAPKRMEEQPVVLKIWATGSEYTDRVVLLEREDFSEGLDDGWDGDKWINPECTKSPLIYAVRTDGTKDAVSALPELDGTVIAFRAGEDNEYTLRFEYAEDNEELYIYDVEKNEYTQIVSGTTYPFTDTNTEAHNRFLLTRSKAPQITTGEKPTSDSSLKGRATKLILDQKLYIYRSGVLYDATGRRVESGEKGGAE